MALPSGKGVRPATHGVDFVGSRHAPYVKPGWTSSQYADPNFDSDHFAQGASTLAWHVSQIADEVRGQRPDVVVLGAGINDLRNGAEPATVNNRLNNWITAARSAKPDLRIIVSPVLDSVHPTRPTLSQRARSYNVLATATVASRTTPESPITIADTTRGWSVEAHTTDNLHPNPTGETLIAQRIAEAFVEVGDLGGPIDIYRRTSWNRQPKVGVSFKGRKAVLSWDAQAVRGARVWIRRAGYAARFPTTVYGGSSMTTSNLVPRATYEFRVSLVRGRTQTLVGPGVTGVARVPQRPAAVSRVTVDAAGVHWTRSAFASHYLVKFRQTNKKRWTTRTTGGLDLRAAGVTRARVWAVNARGRSAMRVGVR